jgi:hypothetical protein
MAPRDSNFQHATQNPLQPRILSLHFGHISSASYKQ